uniref:Uncharacterized protein n=1 Tax=Magallana gigas TaxID=29159 RepID=K1QEH7_MAGGI
MPRSIQESELKSTKHQLKLQLCLPAKCGTVERRSDRAPPNIHNMRARRSLADTLYFNGKTIAINLSRDMESTMHAELKIANV